MDLRAILDVRDIVATVDTKDHLEVAIITNAFEDHKDFLGQTDVTENRERRVRKETLEVGALKAILVCRACVVLTANKDAKVHEGTKGSTDHKAAWEVRVQTECQVHKVDKVDKAILETMVPKATGDHKAIWEVQVCKVFLE